MFPTTQPILPLFHTRCGVTKNMALNKLTDTDINKIVNRIESNKLKKKRPKCRAPNTLESRPKPKPYIIERQELDGYLTEFVTEGETCDTS